MDGLSWQERTEIYNTSFFRNPEYYNRWHCFYQTEDDGFTREYVVLWDDSVANGMKYSRVVLEGRDTLLYRQEGDKVYLLEDDKDILVLDFGLQPGDSFRDYSGEDYVVRRVEKQDGEPTKLYLTSDIGDKEDVWQEGVGSQYWGIVPLGVVARLRSMPRVPVQARVGYAENIENWYQPTIDDENYKMLYAMPKSEGHSDYYFSNDTLVVADIMWLEDEKVSAEVIIRGNEIRVGIGQRHQSYVSRNYAHRIVEFRIPGFLPGTYNLIVNNASSRVLVCGETDGIGEIENSKLKIQNESIYDLSGRRVTEGHRGLKIQNGRKVLY